jgi:hypothetical protein
MFGTHEPKSFISRTFGTSFIIHCIVSRCLGSSRIPELPNSRTPERSGRDGTHEPEQDESPLMKAPCRGAIMVELCNEVGFHRPVGAAYFDRNIHQKTVKQKTS